MCLVSMNRRDASPARQRELPDYLAQRMAPMIRALLLATTVIYVVASMVRGLVELAPTLLAWRLLPALPLGLIAYAARQTHRPQALSFLALAGVLVVQIGINLNAMAPSAAQLWIMPGLLVPVASSVMWLGRWDFAIAMALCALGPLPALVLHQVAGVHVLQYSVYMGISISLAQVLRSFTVRTLLEQFRLEEKLRAQAHTDGLTGLLQRNRFLELAERALRDASRLHQPVCVIYLDVDHFKQLNDNHGHAAGDGALAELGGVLLQHAGSGELIGRLGGEEFALLWPGLDLQHAQRRAEQLRLAAHTIRRPDGALTVSIGMVERRHDHEGIESLLARADEAMRYAKRGGRDRITAT